MRVSTLSASAAIVLAALSLAAHADTSSSRGASVVYYGDLKLDTEQGAKIMLERIELAAQNACHGHATFGPYIGSLNRTFEECRSETVQRAVAQLAAPMVVRVFSEARTRQS